VLFALLMLLAVSAYANELDNACFIDGSVGWEWQGVAFNSGTQGDVFGRSHVAFDFAGSWLRQICDNSKSPGWNPLLHQKEITVYFDLFTEGNTSVDLYIDWWDEAPYNSQDTKPGGTSPHSTLVAQGMQSTIDWTYHTFTVLLPQQPRWSGPRWVFNGVTELQGAAVDTTCYTSVCVPEPSSIVALLSGCAGLGGLILRKRR
jgi:hypothetical protein